MTTSSHDVPADSLRVLSAEQQQSIDGGSLLRTVIDAVIDAVHGTPTLNSDLQQKVDGTLNALVRKL